MAIAQAVSRRLDHPAHSSYDLARSGTIWHDLARSDCPAAGDGALTTRLIAAHGFRGRQAAQCQEPDQSDVISARPSPVPMESGLPWLTSVKRFHSNSPALPGPPRARKKIMVRF